MTAVISGNSLGLLNGSAGMPGQRAQIGAAAAGNGGEAAFLNIASGNLVLQRRDDYLAGHGLDLTLTRTYNALGKLNDDNGDNWKMGLYRQVTGLTDTVNTAGSTITRVAGDGSESVYLYDTTRQRYLSTDGGGAYNTLAYDVPTKRWTGPWAPPARPKPMTGQNRAASSTPPT